MKIELYCSRPNSRNSIYVNEYEHEVVCSAFIQDFVPNLAGKKNITIYLSAKRPKHSCFEVRPGMTVYDDVSVYSETVERFRSPKLLDVFPLLSYALRSQISRRNPDVVYVWFEETQTSKSNETRD